jgi:hypothetical protein
VQVCDAVTDAQASNALAWALRSMLYRASVDLPDQETEVRNAAHRAKEHAEAARGASGQSLQFQPFLQLEILLLDLQLADLAATVHPHAEAYPGSKELQNTLVMCKAQASSILGDAVSELKALAQSAESAGTLLLVQGV